MKDKKNEKNLSNIQKDKNFEVVEDDTKYGEFIPSYFAWIGLSEQKKKAEKLENITKNK